MKVLYVEKLGYIDYIVGVVSEPSSIGKMFGFKPERIEFRGGVNTWWSGTERIDLVVDPSLRLFLCNVSLEWELKQKRIS